MFKKFMSIFMILCFTLTINMVAFAESNNFEKKVHDTKIVNTNKDQHKTYTKNEILVLKKYVSVNDNGLFELDYKKAKADGIEEELLKGQLDYFNFINNSINNGELTADKNLNIISNNKNQISYYATSGHWYSCGGGLNTDVSYHWWGYSRYACDCETQRMSSDFNSVAAVGAGITVVAAYFGAVPAIPPGLSSAYFWLLASRLDANNHGRGVYVEMTWALVFDITPQ